MNCAHNVPTSYRTCPQKAYASRGRLLHRPQHHQQRDTRTCFPAASTAVKRHSAPTYARSLACRCGQRFQCVSNPHQSVSRPQLGTQPEFLKRGRACDPRERRPLQVESIFKTSVHHSSSISSHSSRGSVYALGVTTCSCGFVLGSSSSTISQPRRASPLGVMPIMSA